MSVILRNGALIDAVPSLLYRAARHADARRLANSRWLLRRKSDGRYLACADQLHVGQEYALARLSPADARALRHFLGDEAFRPGKVPGTQTRRLLDQLGLQAARYCERTGLAWADEPTSLHGAGLDRYGRPLWLTADTSAAWRRLLDAAADDDIALDAISGFRSHAYQLGIFRRKLSRGQSVEQILTVNAAPGFSEHHSGEAIDIGTPGEPPAEASFEHTDAFAWLGTHAERFGFRLSYPRDNPHGITYEPWHWRYVGGGKSLLLSR